MESMTGYPIVELRTQKAMPPSAAWKELGNHYMPKTTAARNRLKRELDTIHMVEGEDPLGYIGRVNKAPDD